MSKCCWLYLQTYGGCIHSPSFHLSTATGTIWHLDYCCPLPLGAALVLQSSLNPYAL